MKRLIETLRNIYRIEDLRKRIIYTLGLILIYRLGAHIILPGVDPAAVQGRAAQGGLAGLLDLFSGGAFSRASIFALGIMPYISASIVVQLLGMAIPYFQKLQREGESGRRKMNQITRYLTVIILLLQAPSYLRNLTGGMQIPPQNFFPFTGESISTFFFILNTIILTAGSMFVMWLGERITDKGIGNGISMIIMIGIMARLPFALVAEFGTRIDGSGMVMFLVEIIFLILVILVTILLVQGTRRIPVQFAKRIVGNKQYGGVRQYLPLKVNQAGVMPIIFAQAIMFLPITLIGYNNSTGEISKLAIALTNWQGFWYNLLLGFLIVVFTYFYTAITVNPKQMADDLKKNGGFIPGVKPGKRTELFIDNILSRITLPGSIFLAIVAILPAIVGLMGVNSQFAQFYGGTSLLIMVGVILDTLQQIESHLLMRHYDGLTKSGRIKGRSSVGMTG